MNSFEAQFHLSNLKNAAYALRNANSPIPKAATIALGENLNNLANSLDKLTLALKNILPLFKFSFLKLYHCDAEELYAFPLSEPSIYDSFILKYGNYTPECIEQAGDILIVTLESNFTKIWNGEQSYE